MKVNKFVARESDGKIEWLPDGEEIEVLIVLDDSFDKMERIRLMLDLASYGHCYVGGGAAPMFKLVEVPA